jgi:DNA-directed RNA polymerase subunit K/omega
MKVDRSSIGNAFAFAAVAGARARQLLRGCTPRVEPADKPARTAQREVLAGLVPVLEPEPEPPRGAGA